MKRSTPQLLLILYVLSTYVLAACRTAHAPYQTQIQPDGDVLKEGILYYDISIEVDPSQGIFRSKQRVSITSNLAKGRRLTFFIGENLVIDRLTLEDNKGNRLAIKIWEKGDTISIDYWWGHYFVSEIEIQTVEEIPATGNLVVNLEYHLPPDAIQDGLADNIYNLFVSPQGSHAGGPESGAFPIVSGSLEAPFTMTIKHPHNFLCALPGEQVGLEEDEDSVTVTYRSDIPYDPSFSCAPYQIMENKIQGMRIQIFMPDTVQLSPEMLVTAGEVFSLYQDMFGESPAQSFRIIFPNLNHDLGGGESNGNLIFLANIKPFLNYEGDELAKDMFTHLIAHEGYHLWNTWGLTWRGDLAEWWGEGGANFMASWTKEVLFGSESGANNRLRYLEAFDEEKAYLHKNSLANLDDTWFDDYSLVYDYGAIVWEQLRQDAGSEALTTGLKDFYNINRNQTVSYKDFIASLEKFTDVDVAASLAQWTENNARIDLVIKNVTIQPMGEGFETKVDLEIDADRDYAINTALGYKTSLDDDWNLIVLNLTGSGKHTVQFTSSEQPLQIQIDPEYRVPQINMDNNIWTGR